MVDVWKVRVLVDQRLVTVPMFMWLVTVPGEVVFVLVVFVMDVLMIVPHCFVSMFVLMTFAQMQAGAQRRFVPHPRGGGLNPL